MVRKLSTTKRDPRLDSIPIPLQLNPLGDDENDTSVRDSLLPYFAMGFTTVNTPGDTLECGLHALSISYGAAQNSLLKTGDAPIPSVPVEQWRAWLDSDEYKVHVEGMAELQPGLFTIEEKQKHAEEFSSQKKNLDISQLSVLLQVANIAQGTDFRLGMVTQGYRGRKSEKNDGKFDNIFLMKTAARMADFEMADQPMLWIFSDNAIARHRAWGISGILYNHWEGFSPNTTMCTEGAEPNFDARKVYDYGIGALVESDMNQGVWFLTKDSTPGSKNDHLHASKGTFLREVDAPAGVNVANNELYMRTCKGTTGLVSKSKIQKVAPVPNMPKADTDPTEAKMQLPPTGNKDPPKDPNDKSNDDSSGLKDPTASKRPRKGDNYGYQPFKIFRIIPPTNKAPDAMGVREIVEDPNKFPMKIGDFVLDTGGRGKLTAFVKDIRGEIEEVPLRRLRALENPWRIPDELPFLALEKYICPDAYVETLELAKANGIKQFGTRRNVEKELGEVLTQKANRESVGLSLYSMAKGQSSENLSFLRKNEIVMKGRKKGTIYNYEGYEIKLVEEYIALHQRNPWGVFLSKEEFKNCPLVEKQGPEEADQLESEEDLEEGEVQENMEKGQPKPKYTLKPATKRKRE